MPRFSVVLFASILLSFNQSFAQEKTILIPKPVPGAPFSFEDREDLFGQAYRWLIEGEVGRATEHLRGVITAAGYRIDPNAYYVVVAHFTDTLSSIGMLHGSDDFLNTRLFGLDSSNLYYVFISREAGAPSWLSALAIEKDSPFLQNLPAFLGLFLPIPGVRAAGVAQVETTWVDVRQFTIPEAYRHYSDISFLVKRKLSDDRVLASVVFDNTSKERWSYGVATAITSIDDVDIRIGDDGRIIVEPKPNLDLATFAVVNYHFCAVDTKAKTFGTSIHILGGVRIGGSLELMLGVGGGVSLSFVDLHLFAGYSVEFANELKEGFSIGQQITSNVDPFQMRLRGKPRFGIELKFP